MPQEFSRGDFLIFQLESGYGLMRVLDIEDGDRATVWHVAAYRDLFMDVESAEEAINDIAKLTIEIPHVALTNRAFGSTQVARLANVPLISEEADALNEWKSDPGSQVHDRSIRLLLGLR
jgi:hypothetical protein